MTDSGNYAGRATAIRETAKWIAAIFAGTGAILFSGLSFANLEKIATLDAWLLPTILAVVPILAAAYAVGSAVGVITQDPPDAVSLLPALAPAGPSTPESDLRKRIEGMAPATVATYGSVAAFETEISTVRESIGTAERVYASTPSADNLARVRSAHDRLAQLQDGVRDVTLCADYLVVKDRYDRARWRMLAAALAGVLGAAGSGVLAARAAVDQAEREMPKPAGASLLRISQPTAVHVHLQSGTVAPCPINDGQPATAIGGDLGRPVLLLPPVPAKRSRKPACRAPWRWTPAARDVIVVPRPSG
jgi:hypothetical protein